MTDAEVIARLEKVERENRRLKRCGLAVAVALAGLLAIAATRPIPQVIKAHEFEAVDNSGKVRATLGTLRGMAGEPSISLTGQNRQGLVEGPGLIMMVSNSDEGASAVTIGASHGSSEIMLGDGQGFEMDLGNTKIVEPTTGATQQTSADSIIMFGNGKKHRVIWKAP